MGLLHLVSFLFSFCTLFDAVSEKVLPVNPFDTALDTLTSSQSCLFYLFLSHNPTLFYTEASLHRVILIKLLVSVSFESPISLKQDVPLHHAAFGCYFAEYYGFCDEIRDVAWEDMFGFGADMFCLSSSICQI